MPDLNDGETAFIQGSGAKPYELKNLGGVYSCSCPAWRNQSVAIEKRTCKHLRKYRGDAAEDARLGSAAAVSARKPEAADGDEAAGPPLLLAESWDGEADLTGWWMSEKLDGVRAYWDGKQFLSRLGNVYLAPDWFTAGLPEVPLDGELWLGRKLFQRTISIVRRQDKSEHWRGIKFMVFDAPAVKSPFEERVEFLRAELAGRKPEFAGVHDHARCAGVDHLRTELARLEALGAEGLMLRQPKSTYAAGRSSTLLKVKSFHDAEARVIGHQPGAGRHKGRLGALLVETADGTKFSVGTGFSDAERGAPAAIGSIISFRYQELSDGGVPRFPSFVRARPDVTVPSTLPKPAKKPAGETDEDREAEPVEVVAATVPPPAAVSPKPPAAPTPAAAPRPVATSSGLRRFQFVDGKSSKFWEVAVMGTEVRVRYGRLGASGTASTKTFADTGLATAHAEKLIAEKTEKGYTEIR